MLWVDKYRPKSLDKVIVHEDIAQNLKKLVTEQDCPHLLFYGPSGSGKKTLIMALLKQIYGASAEKVKVENRAWKVDAGSRTIDLELTTLSSTNHVELTPSDAGFQDRYIVQEMIKEMAKNRPIDTKGKKGYKVLVLNEVDKLSREAQHSLRRTMEKYSSSCRLILCCNSSSKVTEAIKSRCLNVRINAPSQEEIVKVLEFVAKKESLQLPHGFAARIAEKSNRSLRRAILSLETCRVQNYPFTDNQAISPMDWEEYVAEISTDMLREQSPKSLFQVRGKVYELLVNCIPPEVLLKRLLYELLRKLDSELKLEEHRMRLGQKAIFHIEVYEHIQELPHLNIWVEKRRMAPNPGKEELLVLQGEYRATKVGNISRLFNFDLSCISALHAQALTLAALAGAAAVEYYDHKTGATDRYPKFLKPDNLTKD
ncbi:hypothetical protein DY000_02025923 [Brassica cretica]|uniref:AAA+ ATPase domain-containing protein n=1 Tax=Brassica cretica TaxID=69181 RepID=A0ABQ7EPG4_BRACR|nr:hypothetical protein DY000_02025923 [Brassica cretica]